MALAAACSCCGFAAIQHFGHCLCASVAVAVSIWRVPGVASETQS